MLLSNQLLRDVNGRINFDGLAYMVSIEANSGGMVAKRSDQEIMVVMLENLQELPETTVQPLQKRFIKQPFSPNKISLPLNISYIPSKKNPWPKLEKNECPMPDIYSVRKII